MTLENAHNLHISEGKRDTTRTVLIGYKSLILDHRYCLSCNIVSFLTVDRPCTCRSRQSPSNHDQPPMNHDRQNYRSRNEVIPWCESSFQDIRARHT